MPSHVKPASLSGGAAEASAAAPQATTRFPSRSIPFLLSHVLACYDQPSPLALAAAGPVCRFACEARGVRVGGPEEEEVEEGVVGGLFEEHTTTTTTSAAAMTPEAAPYVLPPLRRCSGGSHGAAFHAGKSSGHNHNNGDDDDGDDGDLREWALRRNAVSAGWLLQPCLSLEAYALLKTTNAGLRIGCSITFLVASAPLGGPRTLTTAGAERIARWQEEAQLALTAAATAARRGCGGGGVIDRGSRNEEESDGLGDEEGEEGALVSAGSTATITAAAACWPAPAVGPGGVVRVVVLLGEQRIARQAAFGIVTRESDDDDSSNSNGDEERKEEGEEARDSNHRSGSHNAGYLAATTHAHLHHHHHHQQEGLLDGPQCKRDRAVDASASNGVRTATPAATTTTGDDGDTGHVDPNSMLGPLDSPPPDPAVLVVGPEDTVSAVSGGDALTREEALMDDWELEAAAAEAAEEELRTALERRQRQRRRLEAYVGPNASGSTRGDCDGGGAAQPYRAPLRGANSNNMNNPFSAAATVPKDEPPPSAWWFNRPIAAHRNATAATATTGSGGVHPPAHNGSSVQGEEGWSEEEEDEEEAWGRRRHQHLAAAAAHRSRNESLVAACVVHVRYGHGRWLRWLSAEVRPAVLLALSLCSWPMDETTATTESTEAGDSSERRWGGVASGGGGCLSLPLRCLYHESASAAEVRVLIAGISKGGGGSSSSSGNGIPCLEQLSLPYFTSKRLVPAVKWAAVGGAAPAGSRWACLLSGLRRLDLSQGSACDAGLRALIAHIAVNTPEEIHGAPFHHHHPHLPVCPSVTVGTALLTALLLGGCAGVSRLDLLLPHLPLLRVLDVQRTAVDDAALFALCPGFISGHSENDTARSNHHIRDQDGEEEGRTVVNATPTSTTADIIAPSLECLRLCRCRVDGGLVVAGRCFPSLRRLDLRGSAVTNAGLAALARGYTTISNHDDVDDAVAVTDSDNNGGIGGGQSLYQVMERGRSLHRRRHRCRLSALVLDRCPGVTTLAPLWALLPSLRDVSAAACPNLCGAGELALQQCNNNTNGGITAPATSSSSSTARELVALRVPGCARLSGRALALAAILAGRLTLVVINLDDTDITDDALLVLCGFMSATASPPTVNNTNSVSTTVGLLSNDTTNTITTTIATAACPSRELRCESLEVLSLRGCRRLRSLSPLGALPSLRVLIAARSGVESSPLSSSSSSLSLSPSSSNCGLLGLAASRTLETADLSHTNIASIAPLAYIRSLRQLWLCGAPRLTDASLLRFVFAPPSLAATIAAGPATGMFLDLDETRPHGDGGDDDCDAEDYGAGGNKESFHSGRGAVAVAASLEVLDLSGCGGIRLVGCLGRLPALQRLVLSSTAVFDASLYGLFAHRDALMQWRHTEDSNRGGSSGSSRCPHQQHHNRSRDSDTPAARIPDLAELQHRLALSPAAFYASPGVMSVAASVAEVRLDGCTGVRSIEPLGLLPGLRSLDVARTAVDSTTLRGFTLLHITTGTMTTTGRGIRTVTQRRGVGLTFLSVAGCKYITDVSCLSAIPSLLTLDASESHVEDGGIAELVAGRYGDYLASFDSANSGGGGFEFLIAGLTATATSTATSSNNNSSAAHRFRLQRPIALRTLRLAGCPFVRSVGCLVNLPTLRELGLQSLPHTVVDEDVVEALRDRGVQVWL